MFSCLPGCESFRASRSLRFGNALVLPTWMSMMPFPAVLLPSVLLLMRFNHGEARRKVSTRGRGRTGRGGHRSLRLRQGALTSVFHQREAEFRWSRRHCDRSLHPDVVDVELLVGVRGAQLRSGAKKRIVAALAHAEKSEVRIPGGIG